MSFGLMLMFEMIGNDRAVAIVTRSFRLRA